MKYIITTGWWCETGSVEDSRECLLGSKAIRDKEFFSKWYRAVNRYTYPKKILVVDSNSPIKPVLPKDRRLEFISLDENAGHSTNHTGEWSGYTRAAILGMSYALCCDVDYWVYLEQDALIYGENIIEKAIDSMSGEFLFGDGNGTPQLLQQSFMVMKTSFIPKFINNYAELEFRDNLVSPETKFALAALNLKGVPTGLLYKRTNNGFFVRQFIKIAFLLGTVGLGL